MQRRKIVSGIAAGLVAAPFAPLRAQSGFPSGVITVVVPFTPGGSTDTSTRAIMRQVADNTGWKIVVDNKAGGNTLIGTEAVARAAPDGLTIGMVTNNLAVNETLYEGKLRYKLAELVPISLTHRTAHTLLVHPSLPANTLQEFIALAKQKPGEITFGSAGSGTTNHLCGEFLKSVAGLDMLHIPYQGIAQLMPDLYTGRVSALFGSMVTAIETVRAKRMKLLAVTTAERQPAVPDVPAIAEVYPGFAFSSWIGYVAPGGTPTPVVNRLNAEFNKAVQVPEVRAQMEGFESIGSTPAQFNTFIRNEVDKAARIIRAAKIKI